MLSIQTGNRLGTHWGLLCVTRLRWGKICGEQHTVCEFKFGRLADHRGDFNFIKL